MPIKCKYSQVRQTSGKPLSKQKFAKYVPHT